MSRTSMPSSGDVRARGPGRGAWTDVLMPLLAFALLQGSCGPPTGTSLKQQFEILIKDLKTRHVRLDDQELRLTTAKNLFKIRTGDFRKRKSGFSRRNNALVEAVMKAGFEKITETFPPGDAVIPIGTEKREMRAVRRGIEDARKNVAMIEGVLESYGGDIERCEREIDLLHGAKTDVSIEIQRLKAHLPRIELYETLAEIKDERLRDDSGKMIQKAQGLVSTLDDQAVRIDSIDEASRTLDKIPLPGYEDEIYGLLPVDED